MRWRDIALLYLLGLLVFALVGLLTPYPAYMDAEYYTLTGMRLASGEGFTENFIWNYLDGPEGLPRPSHTFWMPLSSLLAAAGLWLSGAKSYWAARVGFLLVAAAIPPLTALLGYHFHHSPAKAWLAGLLALFCGFFWVFLPAVDGFGLYMLCGGILVLLLPRLFNMVGPGVFWSAAATGIVIGVMQLTRSDGILWLVALAGMLLLKGRRMTTWRTLAGLLALLVGGYLLVMAPWYGRNLLEYGTLTPPGTARVLWMTSYDELFSYPPDKLTFAHWWGSGLAEIARARLWALGQNAQTWLAVQGSVFLLPFMLAGLWRMRAALAVQVLAVVWLLTFALMTLVFPFAGVRGSFFHAAAAFQPLGWALVPVGLESFVQWGGRRRGWRVAQAERVFSAGLLLLAIGYTGLVSLPKLALVQASPVGTALAVRFSAVESALGEAGIPGSSLVMVNNPPGYTLATGRMAIAIPHGSLDDVHAAAQYFGAQVMILEPESNLPELYQNPALDARFRLLQVVEERQIYAIEF